MRPVTEYIKETREERRSHLNLSSPCFERGGNSPSEYKGLLAWVLKTTIPCVGDKIDLCHACHNKKCSNPAHLYWGTRKDNMQDAIERGTHSCVTGACAKGGKKLKGRTFEDIHGANADKRRAQLSAQMKARVGFHYTKVECPYCHKTGGRNMMHRYHFDHCKSML